MRIGLTPPKLLCVGELSQPIPREAVIEGSATTANAKTELAEIR